MTALRFQTGGGGGGEETSDISGLPSGVLCGSCLMCAARSLSLSSQTMDCLSLKLQRTFFSVTDLSPPSDWYVNCSQSYRHTSLDRLASCPSTIVVYTKYVVALFSKTTVIKRFGAVQIELWVRTHVMFACLSGRRRDLAFGTRVQAHLLRQTGGLSKCHCSIYKACGRAVFRKQRFRRSGAVQISFWVRTHAMFARLSGRRRYLAPGERSVMDHSRGILMRRGHQGNQNRKRGLEVSCTVQTRSGGGGGISVSLRAFHFCTP